MNLAKLGILPAMQEEEFKFCRMRQKRPAESLRQSFIK